jgi:hypothetical protein
MSPLLLVALALLLPGCAAVRAWTLPGPRPGTAASVPEPAAAPRGPSEALGSPVPPAGGAPAPPRAPGPPLAPGPGASPPPSIPAPTAAPPPTGGTAPAGPTLTASLSPAEARKFREEAQRRLGEAERLLRQVEGRPLAAKDRDTLLLAHSLLEQARKALGTEEYERAANLAIKAHTLADDLASRR